MPLVLEVIQNCLKTGCFSFKSKVFTWGISYTQTLLNQFAVSTTETGVPLNHRHKPMSGYIFIAVVILL